MPAGRGSKVSRQTRPANIEGAIDAEDQHHHTD